MTFLPFASNDLDTVNQFNVLLDHRRTNNGKYNQIMHGRQQANGRASSSGINGAYSGETGLITTNSAFNSSVRIEDVLNEQRQLILDEMKDFEYTEKTLNLGALTPGTGGRPLQSGNFLLYSLLEYFTLNKYPVRPYTIFYAIIRPKR